MNREIKFRAFTKKWGMVYPENHDYEIYVHAQAVWKGGCDEEGVELMQFTGLFDKNGKEIYEGDIILGFMSSDGFRHISAVEWAGFMWSALSRQGNNMIIWLESDFEVIGNVFENKELLD